MIPVIRARHDGEGGWQRREDFYSFRLLFRGGKIQMDLKETEELIQTLLGKGGVIDFREELICRSENVKYKREYTPYPGEI